MPASPHKTKIGFIGLGIMGAPMVLNLQKAGYSPKVYHRTDRPRVQEVVDAGAERVATPKDAADGCDVIITMVTMVITKNKEFMRIATEELQARKLGPFAEEAA